LQLWFKVDNQLIWDWEISLVYPSGMNLVQWVLKSRKRKKYWSDRCLCEKNTIPLSASGVWLCQESAESSRR
jgi:hypothetical protein